MDTRNSMAQSQKHYVKWQKLDTNGYIIYGFIFMSFWKRKHHSTRKQVVAKDWEFGEKGLLVRGHNGTFWDDEIFHIFFFFSNIFIEV